MEASNLGFFVQGRGLCFVLGPLIWECGAHFMMITLFLNLSPSVSVGPTSDPCVARVIGIIMILWTRLNSIEKSNDRIINMDGHDQLLEEN